MAKKGRLIVGLDVGTTKVVTVVGEVCEDGIEIVGFGQARSPGVRKGNIVDIDATVAAIRDSVSQAEQIAGCKIDSVFAGIAGAHVKAFDSDGVVRIKSGSVRQEDVEAVLATARAAAIPTDRDVLHVVPQEYIIDEQGGIRTPLGICGVRLEARVHIVTALSSQAQNVTKCAEAAGLRVAQLVLEPLASSAGVLTQEERELGVCLLDIGGGTTDIAVFGNGALLYTAVIPLGGEHLTRDIVAGLRTPIDHAERLKCRHGCAVAGLVPADEMIEVPSVGDRPPRQMARRILCDVIEPRMEEIFRLVHERLQHERLEEHLTSGLVLTGGASQLAGIEALAEDVLGVLVRRGEPRGVAGLTDMVDGPQYATAVGLLQQGLRVEEERFYLGTAKPRLRDRFTSWWNEVF